MTLLNDLPKVRCTSFSTFHDYPVCFFRHFLQLILIDKFFFFALQQTRKRPFKSTIGFFQLGLSCCFLICVLQDTLCDKSCFLESCIERSKLSWLAFAILNESRSILMVQKLRTDLYWLKCSCPINVHKEVGYHLSLTLESNTSFKAVCLHEPIFIAMISIHQWPYLIHLNSLFNFQN